MDKITIYLGSKDKSSWSLRAWLLLLQTGADFEAVFIQLDKPDTKEKIARISPSGKIPVLKQGHFVVWDSLAIGEYLADLFPKAQLLPADIQKRAIVRSLSCEMHSGFQMLREHLPFNPIARFPGHKISPHAKDDIQRIIQIWETYRIENQHIGPFLFGHFTIADAMFAPVASRFVTYDVKLSAVAQDYVETIMAMPEMQMWCHDL